MEARKKKGKREERASRLVWTRAKVTTIDGLTGQEKEKEKEKATQLF